MGQGSLDKLLLREQHPVVESDTGILFSLPRAVMLHLGKNTMQKCLLQSEDGFQEANEIIVHNNIQLTNLHCRGKPSVRLANVASNILVSGNEADLR